MNCPANMPMGTVRALNLIRVEADLMRKGCTVYRTKQAGCAGDLAIGDEGRLLQIKVVTGYYKRDGISYNRKHVTKADIMAIAMADVIKYRVRGLGVSGNCLRLLGMTPQQML